MNLSEMTEEQLRAIIRQEIAQAQQMSAGETDALRKRIVDAAFEKVNQAFRSHKHFVRKSGQ